MPAEPIPSHFLWAEDSLTQEDLTRLREAIGQPLDISIRINRLKTEPDGAIRRWKTIYGWEAEPLPFCTSGYRIQPGQAAPSATIEHRMGYFYIQEAASMLPAELLDLTSVENPLVLDMAASPGGKTTHLADRTGDNGLIIANDASRSRIPALQHVLDSWGAINQAVACLPGEAFGALYPDKFDAVLLDAPCSMQGLRSAESHKSKTITQSEIEALAARQARLLESALRAVKTGGQVVYSTCTLTPEENEGVISSILETYPGLVKVADIQEKLPVPAPGIREAKGKTYPEEMEKAARIWPHLFGTAGFFAANLIKTEPMPEKAATFGTTNLKPAPPTRPIDPKLQQEIVQSIKGQYGFDLEALMETQGLVIEEYKDQSILAPLSIEKKFRGLPWITCGIRLGKFNPGGWQPSHTFASRFGDQFTKGIIYLEDSQADTWIKGADIRGFESEGSQRGEVFAIRDRMERNLGLGKTLEKRLRNLLPTRLF